MKKEALLKKKSSVKKRNLRIVQKTIDSYKILKDPKKEK